MSNVQVTDINGVKIYNLTGGKSLYELMKESKFSIKKMKKNDEYINHFEIIQECGFPVSSECLTLSNDGNYLFASGIYPPRLKIFDLNEMTLKCERGFDAQIRKIEIITDDYKKVALLCDDRTIELHAQYGKHFKIRIPKYGRDLKYDKIYCDLFACGTGKEIYRLNLNQGQFLKSFECSNNVEGINAISINEPLELLGAACEGGVVDIFDLRTKEKCFTFDEGLLKNSNDLTAISFSEDGMQMGLGNSDGVVNIFDIRNPKPLLKITHSYHLPIQKIIFDSYSKNIITVDKKITKFSNYKTGKPFINIEPKYDINDFAIYKKSGMFFFSNESEKIDIYFVPQLGPSPKWASFLDNITEELEEAKNYSLYEDYKFLTKKELEDINGAELIGTKMVKAYMHGYFIDWKLYKKLKAVNEPFDYEKYLAEKKEAKFKKYFGERIVMNKTNDKIKVNKKYFDFLKNQTTQQNNDEDYEEDKNENNKKQIKKGVDLTDDRFKKIFSDKNFEIDFNSEKFKQKTKAGNLHFENVEEETGNNLEGNNNNNQKKEEENDLIVNKELLQLNEKLLNKKRKKIEKLHSNYFDEKEKDIAFEDRVRENDNLNDEEEENAIVNKIRKLENIKNKNKYLEEKRNKEANLIKNKRILAGSNKLNQIKYK